MMYSLSDDLKIFGTLSIVLVFFFFIICMPLAWQLIMWRNRSLRTLTPPGTTFRPFKPNLFAVSGLIFAFLYSLFVFVFIVVRLDYQLFVMDLVNALTGEDNNDIWEAAGVGAILGIFMYSVWGMVWSTRLLWRTRGQVDMTLPPALPQDDKGNSTKPRSMLKVVK